jgi:hypothetical protein
MDETYNKNYYIMIEINDRYYIDDKEITGLLNIYCEEYQQFLLNNKAFYNTYKELMFRTEKDCYNCIKNLKEKYSDRLIYLKLIGV